jgi:hypothetical protein
MRPMRASKRIIHVDVGEGRQLARKVRIVPLLLGVEAHILQKQNVSWLERFGHALDLGTDRIRRHLHRLAQ